MHNWQRQDRDKTIQRNWPVWEPHRAARQRLDQTRDEVRFRPPEPVQQLPQFLGNTQRQHGATVPIPGPNQRLAEPLALSLRYDDSVCAPGALDLESLEGHANGQRWIVPNNRWSFARDPDSGLSGRIVRIAAMLPVPTQARGVGGIGAVRPAVQQINAAAIFRAKTVDFRHRNAPDLRGLF